MNLKIFFKKLFQLNSQAGYLRLFFTIILLFLLWSFLALINAIYNPLGKLNLTLFPNIISSNLALSLIKDILKAYFSIFSLGVLFLLILTFNMCFLSVVSISSILGEATTFKEKRDLLSYYAFSIPALKKYNFPIVSYPESENDSSLFLPNGPLIASIKAGYALFISSHAENKVWANLSTEKQMDISLEYQEKVIDCFNIQPGKIQLVLDNPLNDFYKSFKIKIDLAYFYQVPDQQNGNDQSSIKNLFEYFGSPNIRYIIEKVIISEVKTTFTQLALESKDILSLPRNPIDDKNEISSINNIRNHHIKMQEKISFHINHYPVFQTVKRNRKRSLYLNPNLFSIFNNKINGVNIPQSYLEIINEKIMTNFQNTMKYFFGSEVVKIKILSFGEQEIK
jgi:hypothetical protein